MALMRRWLVAALLLAGCASNPGEIREVVRPAPVEAPRARRFELELVVAIGSDQAASRSLELWVPLVSSEPGLQTVELTSTCIAPDTSSEVTADARGNRVLHVRRDGPGVVAVTVRQRILRKPATRVDLARAETRALTPLERATLAPELPPPGGGRGGVGAEISLERVRVLAASGDVATLRSDGVPAREVSGLELGRAAVTPARWLEAYVPGLGWTAFVADDRPGEIRETVVVVSRAARGTAWAVKDSEPLVPRSVIHSRDLREEEP
jgi:hypothetical protein